MTGFWSMGARIARSFWGPVDGKVEALGTTFTWNVCEAVVWVVSSVAVTGTCVSTAGVALVVSRWIVTSGLVSDRVAEVMVIGLSGLSLLSRDTLVIWLRMSPPSTSWP